MCDAYGNVVINPNADLSVAGMGLSLVGTDLEAPVKIEWVIVDAEKETTRVVMGAGPWGMLPE